MYQKIALRDDFICADLHTILELFETITNQCETLQIWNAEMKAFLSQERRENAFEIRL